MNKDTLLKLIKEEITNMLNENNIRNKLVEKAKTKKDGIYSHDGVLYRVKNNILTHYCKQGSILEVNGYFDVPVARYENTMEAKRILKTLDNRK